MIVNNYFVFGNESSDYVYVPILKNAHSWGEQTFAKYFNFSRIPLDLSKKKQFIIFLRDPIDRWLSGIPQYIENLLHSDENSFSFLDNNFLLDPLHIDLICTKVDIETHTKKQNDAIDFLLHYPCVFFYLNDENFQEKLTHFFIHKMGAPSKISLSRKNNTTNENPRKKSWRKQLQKAIDTNKLYKDNITLYYKDDYDLIERRKFYNIKYIESL